MTECDTAYSTRFDDALQYASSLHRYQYRKGTCIPYITHLLSVAAIVGEHGGTEDEVIAALLHDVVEDQGGAPILTEIRERFGDEVAGIVSACSDTDEDPKPAWTQRKARYLSHVPEMSDSARLVSMADKLHNARSILADIRLYGDNATYWDRFNGKRDGTIGYYCALVDAFRACGTTPLVLELGRVIEEIESLTLWRT